MPKTKNEVLRSRTDMTSGFSQIRQEQKWSDLRDFNFLNLKATIRPRKKVRLNVG